MKIVEITGNGIKFDDGTEVSDYHNQDCCENVYADWEQLKDTTIWDKDFKELKFTQVPNSGFRIDTYFVPCYNRQNGYYGSDLFLTITKDGEIKEIDISDCTADDIS